MTEHSQDSSNHKSIKKKSFQNGDSRIAGEEPPENDENLEQRPSRPTVENYPMFYKNQHDRKKMIIAEPLKKTVKSSNDLSYSVVRRQWNNVRNSTSNQSGSCFVATMAFGTPWANEVQTLRDFRDEKLQCYCAGRVFISFYYTFGPYMAKAIENKPLVKKWVRHLLRKLIILIRNKV